MVSILRKLVSKQKKRYEENGFDLDLAYVTKQIIAMGYPAESLEALYRNPMPEVKRFLEYFHKSKYKVWSLTAEPSRKYDHAHFHGRVEESWQFYDHEAPPFDILLPFCQNVYQWLSQDPSHVAAIHCKAGKGRTGVMISAYLLYAKHQPNAQKALQFYADQRTKNKKGVTIPSQQRAIYYFERMLNNPLREGVYSVPHPGQKLRISKIRLTTVPIGGCTPAVYVYNAKFQEIYSSAPKDKKKSLRKYTDHDKEIVFKLDVPVYKDFKIMVAKEKKGKMQRMFQFWINTEFIDNFKVLLDKKDLDKAYKDVKKHVKYTPNFQVEVEFLPDGNANHALSSKDSHLVIL